MLIPMKRPANYSAKGQRILNVPGGTRAPLPQTAPVQLATLATAAPDGEAWLHEFKYDGYRMLCRVDQDDVRFLSRTGQDWTSRLQVLADAVRRLRWGQALVDGEVVVLDEHGVSSFQALQNALGREGGTSRLCYFAFDLLHVSGFDVTALSLDRRKALLEKLLRPKSRAHAASRIRFSEHIIGYGDEFHRQACEAKLEGIISKRRDAPYTGGRSSNWMKVKCRQGQELVIIGYTKPSGTRQGFGALLLGYYTDDDRLVYAGRVGTGFSDRLLRELQQKLKKLEQKQPTVRPSPAGIKRNEIHWVKPELVANVEFTNWTQEGLLRQASFQGLREDKPAQQVRREQAEGKTSGRSPGATRQRRRA